MPGQVFTGVLQYALPLNEISSASNHSHSETPSIGVQPRRNFLKQSSAVTKAAQLLPIGDTDRRQTPSMESSLVLTC